jgi:lysozyme
MKRVCVAVLCAVLMIVAGCGGTTPASSPRVAQPATVTCMTLGPPCSAVTPEGARPQAPPVSLGPVTVSEKHIDAAGLRFVEGFENIYKVSYCPEPDPAYGWGVPTRGFGETSGITRGSPCISHAQAETNLRLELGADYEWAIRDLNVAFDQHEWDALCDFVWNLGAGIFQGTSVGADLRARAFGAATARILEYDHAAGVVLPGLRARREAEVRLFDTPEPKPRPISPAEKRKLIAYWTHERAATLAVYHRYCTPWSTGPRCTGWRRRQHVLWLDVRRLEG